MKYSFSDSGKGQGWVEAAQLLLRHLQLVRSRDREHLQTGKRLEDTFELVSIKAKLFQAVDGQARGQVLSTATEDVCEDALREGPWLDRSPAFYESQVSPQDSVSACRIPKLGDSESPADVSMWEIAKNHLLDLCREAPHGIGSKHMPDCLWIRCQESAWVNTIMLERGGRVEQTSSLRWFLSPNWRTLAPAWVKTYIHWLETSFLLA